MGENLKPEITEEYIRQEIEKITKQIKDNPLTKDEFAVQFVEKSKEFGIKHAFTFDEAWEMGIAIRNKIKFRNHITKLEEELIKHPDSLIGEPLMKVNPLKHSFADGCYIREIFNPAGELIVTKIHKQKHCFFLIKGKMSILTENGVEHIEAPYHGITVPGTKRVIYAHTDCIFITVHATKHTDIDIIEKEIIAEDFNDPIIKKEDIDMLMRITKDKKIQNK